MRRFLENKFTVAAILLLFAVAFAWNTTQGAGWAVPGHFQVGLYPAAEAHGSSLTPNPWDHVRVAHGPGMPPDPWDDGTCQSTGTCPPPTTLGNCGTKGQDPCPDGWGADAKAKPILVAHGPGLPPDPWDQVRIAHGPGLPPDPWDQVRIAHGPGLPPDPWDRVRIAHGPGLPPDPWDQVRIA